MNIVPRRIRGLAPVLGLLLLALPGAAEARAVRATETVAQGTVTAVVDGDTLALESGVEVRLVGIQAPKLPLGRRGFRAWPLADEARQALESLALGKRLSLSYGGRKIDRHGRLLAHLHDDAKTWIQGAMLSRGLARVYTFSDNRARAAEMLALERQAREAGRGIWSEPFYRIRNATDVAGVADGFQLVEGRVRDVAIVRGRGYLNFGGDWRTDFSVAVSPADLRRFEGGGAWLETLKQRDIRVRGWVRRQNGPLIEVTHPEQIELLP